MKKTYSYPTMNVVKFETRRGLLFGSGGDTLNGGGNKGDYTGSGQLGRGNDGDDW